jgi:SAM-dependent methyltransferase
VSRHKLWEYARSVFVVLAAQDSDAEKNLPRVLDFGGAATLPVFFLASRGCEMECLDLDLALVDWTNDLAARHGWSLHASEDNLVEAVAPAHWQPFDAVISASVLEHIPKQSQGLVVRRLGALLRPGGVLAITFDYGDEAPQPGAIRDPGEVHRLVAASGLAYPPAEHADTHFHDTGERFALDRRHPRDKFTFGSLFLQKP